MPRSQNFKSRNKNEKVQNLRKSNMGSELVSIAENLHSNNLIPIPFNNFIRIMIPQIKRFENKSKKEAMKIAWHRWEVMSEGLRRPFRLMQIVEK